MALAYSIDLRERVVDQHESGMSIQELCRLFKLGAATIYRWILKKKETGSIEPTKQARRGGSKPKLKPEEYEEFKQFLRDNIGLNSIQLAKKWGRGMTPGTMRKWIKRLEFTLKKNNFHMPKQMQKSKEHF